MTRRSRLIELIPGGRADVVFAVVAALATGAAIVLISGNDPVSTYRSLLASAFGPGDWTRTAARAAPIIGMGLAISVPLRGGHLNLGGEGQLVVGGLVSALVAGTSTLSGPLALLLGIAAGALAAGVYGLCAAELYVCFDIPMVVTSLLLSYLAISTTSYLARYPLRDEGSGLPQTSLHRPSARLPLVPGIEDLGTGVLVIGALVVVAVVVDRWTATGFEVRMTGAGPRFSEHLGTDLRWLARRGMFLSGAIAGLTASLVVLGEHHRFIDGALITPGYSWTGVVVALLVGGSPLGVAVAGLFFAVLQVGGEGMERATQTPRELTQIIQGVMLFFLAAAAGSKQLRTRRRSPSGVTPSTAEVPVAAPTAEAAT